MDVESISVADAAALYEQSIVIPPLVKREKTYILCPVGLVGAGKTSCIKPLSEHLQFVRISSDEIRQLLKRRRPAYTQSDVYTIWAQLARKYMGKGYSITCDCDCASREKVINAFLQEFKAEAIWVHINTPEEFILSRLRNYNHTWLFKDADTAIQEYYKRKPLHARLTIPFSYVFDRSRDDLPQQIGEACDIIRLRMGENMRFA